MSTHQQTLKNNVNYTTRRTPVHFTKSFFIPGCFSNTLSLLPAREIWRFWGNTQCQPIKTFPSHIVWYHAHRDISLFISLSPHPEEILSLFHHECASVHLEFYKLWSSTRLWLPHSQNSNLIIIHLFVSGLLWFFSLVFSKSIRFLTWCIYLLFQINDRNQSFIFLFFFIILVWKGFEDVTQVKSTFCHLFTLMLFQ